MKNVASVYHFPTPLYIYDMSVRSGAAWLCELERYGISNFKARVTSGGWVRSQYPELSSAVKRKLSHFACPKTVLGNLLAFGQTKRESSL